jgi:hypothetical protein
MSRVQVPFPAPFFLLRRRSQVVRQWSAKPLFIGSNPVAAFFSLTIYPFLFSISPALFLYSRNLNEVEFSQTVPALMFSLLISLLLWGIARLVFSDRARAGIASLFLLVIFFSYGRIYAQVEFLFDGLGIGWFSHPLLIFLLLAAGLAAARPIHRSKRDFTVVTPYLNFTAVCLLLFNILPLTAHLWRSRPVTLRTVPERLTAAWRVRSCPDVYFILLDEYAPGAVMKDLYQWDNSDFEIALEKRGFVISRESRTRYCSTESCLASILNMRYLTAGENPYSLIQESRVASLFKELGYKIYIFPLVEKASFRNADGVFTYRDPWYNPFNFAFAESSLLRTVYDWILQSEDSGRYFRESIRFIFDKLPVLAHQKGPKFVYCHIMCPHAPFVFDSNGGPVEPRNFFNLKDRRHYLNQYRFVNQRVLETVDSLRRNLPDPVIIIQSDHGQRGRALQGYQMPVGKSWQRTFSSFHLPDAPATVLIPAISPGDTFRIVFNTYFGAEFPLLSDRTDG